LKRIVLVMATLTVWNLSLAQVGTTVQQGSAATADKAKQYGDQAKGAVSSQPDKSMDQAQAKVNKAKAHHHAKAAKTGAKEIPK
jgi:hypothetical protein